MVAGLWAERQKVRRAGELWDMRVPLLLCFVVDYLLSAAQDIA